MGNTLGSEKSRQRQKELEELLDQIPPEIDVDKQVPFRSWWICSVVGALVSIPVGIKRKSLGPLLMYGTTGALLDLFGGFGEHERKRREWMREYVAQHGPYDPERTRDGDDEMAVVDGGFVQEADPWVDANAKKKR